MAITPRCSACRLPFTPKPGSRTRRCPGCQRERKRAKAKQVMTQEQRDIGEREARMLSRGRSVPSCGEG